MFHLIVAISFLLTFSPKDHLSFIAFGLQMRHLRICRLTSGEHLCVQMPPFLSSNSSALLITPHTGQHCWTLPALCTHCEPEVRVQTQGLSFFSIQLLRCKKVWCGHKERFSTSSQAHTHTHLIIAECEKEPYAIEKTVCKTQLNPGQCEDSEAWGS